MIYIRTGHDVPIADIKRLWDRIPFAKGRDPESIAAALMNTSLFAHGWDNSQLIATTRVLSDGTFYATLWDVIVDPAYQRQGIGRQIVKAAVEPFRHRGFSFIAIFSVPDAEPFYQSLGFVHQPHGMILKEDR